MIQEESPGSKTNKGDPPFSLVRISETGLTKFFRVEQIKLRISIKTFSNYRYKIIYLKALPYELNQSHSKNGEKTQSRTAS